MKFISAVSALLLGAALAHGETYFWHRDPALNPSGTSAGGIARSYNWSSKIDGSGVRPASVADDAFEATALDPAWKLLDADGSDSTGSMEVKNGKLILRARGDDFTKDKHFLAGAYREDIKGVFDVTVRVDSQYASHHWSKAGIIMSNDLTNFSKGGTALVAVTPGEGVIFESSLSVNGYIDKTYYPNPIPGLPVWLRLVKGSSTVTAWYRTDSTLAWTQIGSQETPAGMGDTPDSDVGLFAVMVDSAGKTNKTTAASFEDFRGGQDIASAGLDLRFNGTGPGNGVDVIFSGNFSAHSLDFTGYAGKLSFVSNTLTLSGGATFSPLMNIVAGTGTIAFTGATGTNNLFLKPNDTLPALVKTGAGDLVIQNATLSAPSLRVESGSIDFNGNNADLGGFASTGGSIKGLAADDSLIVTGNADFSGLESLSAPLGNVVIKSAGSAPLLFNPGGKTFPKLTLWTAPASAKSSIVVGPGSLSTLSGLVLRNKTNSSGFDGLVDFRAHGPSVSIDGDLLQVKDGTGTSAQTLLFGNGSWTVQGNMNVSLAAGGSADASVFHFSGISGIQTLSVTGGPLSGVEHDAPGTLKLASALSATRLRQSSGSFDFGGFNLALKGDLAVVKGERGTFLNLGGRTLTVEGNASFAGKVSGDTGVGLMLNPDVKWILKVSGTLTADSTDVGNCDASGFAKGIASEGSHDRGKNLNWQFWSSPLAASVLRDPVDVAAKPGWKVTFTVGAQGSAPMDFEWRRQGDTTVLSRDTLLVLDSVKLAQNGNAYYCVVSNPLGKDTTRQAILLVRDCETSFLPPADLKVAEGGRVVLAGKAGCASEVLWSPVSGPVPKLFDPGVETLIFTAPRVQGDSVLVLQFSAVYGSLLESKNVKVTVKDTIPDPAASLDPQPVWNGAGSKVLRAKIANKADLARFPTYPLRYLWTVDPFLSDSAAAGDSLVLTDPLENGTVEVTVCADNGGTPSCAKIDLEIQRVSTSLLLGRAHAGPVRLSSGGLSWNRTGMVRILDWNGRILWQRWGTPGATAQLPSDTERSLRAGAARMDFLAPGR
jgi:regulation of enolase protein 1 (concanavalin A-like superfamily)